MVYDNGSQRSEEHRVDIVRQYVNSGLSIRKFYSQNTEAIGVSERSFFTWLSKYKDQVKYDLDSGQALSGVSRYESWKDEDGNTQARWVKSSKEKQTLADYCNILMDGIEEIKPKDPNKYIPRDVKEDLCSVIPIGDAHIGMWCPDWDLKKAEHLMCAAFDYLVGRSKPCKVGFIFNVGDWFHYHSLEGVTEASRHVVDRSGSPQDMLEVGMKIMHYLIDISLMKHEKVHVVNVAGNHDGLLAFMFAKHLKFLYRDDPRVFIDDSHAYRHYASFGKNLFGIAHGDKTKDAALGITMAKECPQEWAESDGGRREWFRGHHHHDSQVEHNGGVYVRQVRTLTAGDNYATSHAFISGRDMKRITYNAKTGWAGEEGVTPEMLV